MFFFFNDTATTEIYTLSLHDALPISRDSAGTFYGLLSNGTHLTGGSTFLADQGLADRYGWNQGLRYFPMDYDGDGDRKSTRLNSSHANISYAVFCLKKKTARSAPMPV